MYKNHKNNGSSEYRLIGHKRAVKDSAKVNHFSCGSLSIDEMKGMLLWVTIRLFRT